MYSSQTPVLFSSLCTGRVFDPKYDLDVGDKDLTHEEEPQELPDVQGASGSASAKSNIPFLAEDFSSAGQQQADPEPQPKQSAKAKREAARAAKKQLEQQERLDAQREKEQREREDEEQQEAQVAKRDKRERQREMRERKKLAAEQAQSSQAPSASGSRRARKVVLSDAEDDEDISAQKVRSPPKGATGSRFEPLSTYAHESDMNISAESTDDETRTRRLLFEPREESTSTSAVSGTLNDALEKFTLDAVSISLFLFGRVSLTSLFQAVQDDVEPIPSASVDTQSQQRSECKSLSLAVLAFLIVSQAPLSDVPMGEADDAEPPAAGSSKRPAQGPTGESPPSKSTRAGGRRGVNKPARVPVVVSEQPKPQPKPRRGRKPKRG